MATTSFGCGFRYRIPFPGVSVSSPSSPLLRLPLGGVASSRVLKMAVCAVSYQPTGKPKGIMRPRRISPAMQELVGVPEISRTEALKLIWAHIKQNNLQDPDDKRIIVCDEKLKNIFAGKDRIKFLEIAGLITPHFL